MFGLEHLGHVLEAVAICGLHACCWERHGNDSLSDVGEVKVKFLINIAFSAPREGEGNYVNNRSQKSKLK